MKKIHKWTEKEIAFIKKEIRFNGLGIIVNHDELGKQLKRTRSQMYGFIRFLISKGVIERKGSEEYVLNFIKNEGLYAETNQILNLGELSEALLLSKETLKKRIAIWRKSGDLPQIDYTCQFDSMRRYYSEEVDKKIINMKKQGVSEKEIAYLIDRDYRSVRARISILQRDGKLEVIGYWEDWEVEVVTQNVTFDENGMVNNYPKLMNLLQCRRGYKAIADKIGRLRKAGIIETKPIPGTTSVSALKRFHEFNDMRFAGKGQASKKQKSQIIYTHQTKKPTSVAAEVSKKQKLLTK